MTTHKELAQAELDNVEDWSSEVYVQDVLFLIARILVHLIGAIEERDA